MHKLEISLIQTEVFLKKASLVNICADGDNKMSVAIWTHFLPHRMSNLCYIQGLGEFSMEQEKLKNLLKKRSWI